MNGVDRLFGLTLLGSLLWGGAAVADAEPWADRAIPVTKGLALWLDAGRQPAAWRADGKSGLGVGNDFDVWYDGSGRGENFVLAVQAAQPRYVAGEHAAAVGFDGAQDFLQRGG